MDQTGKGTIQKLKATEAVRSVTQQRQIAESHQKLVKRILEANSREPKRKRS